MYIKSIWWSYWNSWWETGKCGAKIMILGALSRPIGGSYSVQEDQRAMKCCCNIMRLHSQKLCQWFNTKCGTKYLFQCIVNICKYMQRTNLNIWYIVRCLNSLMWILIQKWLKYFKMWCNFTLCLMLWRFILWQWNMYKICIEYVYVFASKNSNVKCKCKR